MLALVIKNNNMLYITQSADLNHLYKCEGKTDFSFVLHEHLTKLWKYGTFFLSDGVYTK